MIVMFRKQLPIQIVVADSVADSKIQVRIGNRQLVSVADSKSVIIVSRVQIFIYAPGSETNQALALFQKW